MEWNGVETTGFCCPNGFYAAPGWDPVTGRGSMNVANFIAAAIALP